jgi:thiosulfate/3-mercaptopyruvate sulfurtransferase
MKALQCFLAFLLTVAPALAQTTPEPLLVDVDYLAKHLNDRNLVLIEVGSKPAYEAGHIAGARFIPLDDLSTPMRSKPGELSFELLPADMMRAKLASLGVSDDSHIVVYSGNDSSFPMTSRVIFTLQYLGMGDHTSLLNGGIAAWRAAERPVSTTMTPIHPGHLSARPTANIVADASLVRSISERPNFKLVDARSPAIYKGVEPTYSKAGHIPGAINIPFSDILDGSSKVDVNRLEKIFADAGIKPGDTVVTYCHIGAQATETLFGARVLGHPVMLYDGSFQDWATNNRGEVVK